MCPEASQQIHRGQNARKPQSSCPSQHHFEIPVSDAPIERQSGVIGYRSGFEDCVARSWLACNGTQDIRGCKRMRKDTCKARGYRGDACGMTAVQVSSSSHGTSHLPLSMSSTARLMPFSHLRYSAPLVFITYSMKTRTTRAPQKSQSNVQPAGIMGVTDLKYCRTATISDRIEDRTLFMQIPEPLRRAPQTIINHGECSFD